MSKMKRVLAAANRSKEHPRCRLQIERLGLRPNPSVAEWDGFALNPDGSLSLIAGLMRTQMAKMIVEGYWNQTNSD